MSKIFIISSRKFYDEVERIMEKLKEQGHQLETIGEVNKNSDYEKDKEALLRSFDKIENSDIIYVYSKGGYVGKTVSMEIAYAYSKNKEVISCEEINEFSARALVNKIKKPEKFIKYLE